MSISSIIALLVFAVAVAGYILYRKRGTDGSGRVSWRPGKKE